MNTPTRRIALLATLTLALAGGQRAQSATYVWNVDPPGPNNWNVNADWDPNTGNPGGADTAIFGAVGTVADALTINNVVSVSTTVTGLVFTNTSSGTWHVTRIPAGVALSVTNLTVGFGAAVNSLVTSAAMVDGGTLNVYGNLTIGNNGSTGADTGTILDLSGLSNFVYRATNSTIALSTGNRSAANLNLAAISNHITAGTMNLNTASSSSSATGTLTLGAGTNSINVGTINIGGNRNTCRVQFPAGATGGLRLRGLGGTDSDLATMTIGNHNNSGGSGSSATGTLSLNGNPVDMKLGTLTLGRQSNGTATGIDTGRGTLSFDTGTVSATNILMAITTTSSANGVANGTNNVGANGGIPAVLNVGTGGISMVNQATSSSPGNNGTINLIGGTLISAGPIFKSAAAGNATLSLSAGATLSLTAGAASLIGSPAAPIDTFELADSTLNLPVVSSQASATVATFTPSGAANVVNITMLPPIASYPAQFPLISYATLAGIPNLALGTLPGGYSGYISNNAASIDLVITGSSIKSLTWNGNVSGNWDTSTANWRYSGNAVAYQQGDMVNFDDSLGGTANVVLTTNVAPGAVGFNNSGHNYTLSGTFKITGPATLTKQGSSLVTLTGSGGDDFSGGIVVNGGTLILDQPASAISGGLTLNGGVVQIGNNDTNGAVPAGNVVLNDASTLVFNRTDSLTLSTAIAGTGSLTQNGSGTVILTGVNLYTGNTTITAGTLALSGPGAICGSANVAVAGGTLDVSAASQPTLSGLTLNNGNLAVAPTVLGGPGLNTTNLTFAGAANHLNVVSLPALASYPVTFTMIQAVNPASGSFNLSLGSLPAGYTGSISQSADQTAVLLTVTSGPIGDRPAVFWTGADVALGNTNWSDRSNWKLPGAPQPAETVVFNNTAVQTASALMSPGGGSASFMMDYVNNIVNSDFTISALVFTNLDASGNYHNTLVGAGRTLSITNAGLTVGAVDTGTTAMKDFVSISGARGSLTVQNTNGNVNVWAGSGSVSGSQSVLDLSALDNFTASVSRFLVGATIGNAVNRPSGIIYLARTNAITAGYQTATSEAGSATGNGGIVVADCNSNAGSPSYMYLGQVNSISADVMVIGRQKATGHLLFNPLYPNNLPYPRLTLQGANSGKMSYLDIGDGAGNTGTTTLTADADLSGGIVTGSIATLNVGRASGATSGSGTTTGTLTFDAGTIQADTLNIGLQPASGSKVGIGTVNVSSNAIIGAAATLIVNGPASIGATAGGAGAATTAGTLNINNGVFQAASITAGATSTINLTGGRFIAMGPVGSPAAPLGTLNLSPLGTPENSRNTLQLAAGLNPSLSVVNLTVDGQPATTNLINIGSVGPVGATPVELPLITYGSMSLLGGVFNIGLGTLPAGYSGYLTNDTVNSRIGLVLTAAQHPQPRITAFTVVSGTNLVVSGVNGFINAPYYLLGTTNVALPVSSWSPVATNNFAPDGSFSCTTVIDPAKPQQFFRLQVP